MFNFLLRLLERANQELPRDQVIVGYTIHLDNGLSVSSKLTLTPGDDQTTVHKTPDQFFLIAGSAIATQEEEDREIFPGYQCARLDYIKTPLGIARRID